MKQFIALIVNHPKKVLAVIFGITLVMVLGVTKLEIRNNQDSELPDNDPIVQTMDRIEEIFDDKSMIILGVESKDIYTEQTLQKIADISEELKQIEWVIPDEINSLSLVNNIKSRDWGLETGPFMKDIPKTKEAIEQLKNDVVTNDNIYGQLVSKDGTFAAIVANISEDYDQALLHKAVYDIVDKYQGEDKIYVSGEPIWLEDIESGINADSGILTPVTLLVIVLCFFLCFRTANGVILPIIVVILSIVWTMGMMGHMGLPMTVVSNALPALMVAVASSYGIHMVHRYYEAIDEDEDKAVAIANALRSVTPPIVLTGITSALGAGTLIIFKVTSMREFGVIAAIGIIAALILSITVIPAVYMLLKKVKTRTNTLNFISRFLVSITNFSYQNRRSVLLGYVVILLISIYGISRVIIGADFVQNFPKDHKGRIAVDAFNEHLGGVRFFNIMLDGDKEDALKDPEFLSEMLKFQDYMEAQEGVGNVFSFANIIKRMHMVINQNEPKGSVALLPDTKNLIAQYLLLYSMSGDPGDFKDLIDFDYQRAKVQVMLTTSEPQDHKRLYKIANDYLDTQFLNGKPSKASFGGDVMFWIAQIGYIVKGKIENVLASIAIVLLICMFVFRSVKAGFFSIIPLIFSTLITFAFMGFTGVRLEIGTAILTAMVVGIGVDFAIHYLNRFKEEAHPDTSIEEMCLKTANTSGKAIAFDVFSNVCGFSVLVISEFLPVQNFGLLLALSMLIVGFNTMFMFPALIGVFKPKYFTGQKAVKALFDKQKLKKVA